MYISVDNRLCRLRKINDKLKEFHGIRCRKCNNNICIAVGDLVIKRGRVGIPLIFFNPAVYLCLYQART